jgi:cytochrome c biogenesis factor
VAEVQCNVLFVCACACTLRRVCGYVCMWCMSMCRVCVFLQHHTTRHNAAQHSTAQHSTAYRSIARTGQHKTCVAAVQCNVLFVCACACTLRCVCGYVCMWCMSMCRVCVFLRHHTTQHNAAQHSTAQYSTAYRSIAQHGTAQNMCGSGSV